MINKINTVLSTLMHEKQLTSSELARKTGIAQPVIYRIASGETDNPKIDTLIPIANYFNISMDELTGITTINNINENITVTGKKIPIVEWESLHPNFKLGLIPNSIYVLANTNPSIEAFALKVQNDLMQPIFTKNTILIFDPTKKAKTNSYTIVASTKTNTVSLKQLIIDGDDWYLKSPNPELRTTFIENKKEIEFIGTLVEMTKIYD